MKYDASQIRLKHIPKLEQIRDATCYRKYLYFFSTLLPQQNYIDQIANDLEQKFIFSTEQFDILQDIEIRASIIIKRIDDYQA